MDEIYEDNVLEQSVLNGDFSSETTEDEEDFKYNELLFPSSLKKSFKNLQSQ